MTEARRIGAIPGQADYEDPDTAPVPASAAPTVGQGLLADLAAQLTAAVTHEDVVLEVQMRPGVAVRYSTELDDAKLTQWRKMSTKQRGSGPAAVDDFNSLRFCSLVLANQCKGLLFNREEARDEEGTPLTFGHKWTRDLYQKQRSTDVVREVYGSDAHIMVDANFVMDKAGFSDQAVEVDGEGPTSAS